MSKAALLDLCAESGRTVAYAEEDGKTFLVSRQDVAPIVQAAKDMWSDKPPLDMRRVALIPKEVVNQAMIDGWFHDEAAWKKWANAPENACYRTCKGSI